MQMMGMGWVAEKLRSTLCSILQRNQLISTQSSTLLLDRLHTKLSTYNLPFVHELKVMRSENLKFITNVMHKINGKRSRTLAKVTVLFDT